jgi:Zn-dependent protease
MLNLSSHDLICRILTLIIAVTVHEFAHAFTADRLGDSTPRDAGQVTLNPLKHLDIFGSLMILLTGFGWGKPTPINAAALRQRTRYGVVWVSLAGPLSNLLLAVAAAIPIRMGWVQLVLPTGFLPTLGEFFYIFFYLNIVLAIFNLLPFPPLDGEKVVSELLPAGAAAVYDRIRPYGPFVLMILIFIGPRINFDLIGMIMTPLINGAQTLLLGF